MSRRAAKRAVEKRDDGSRAWGGPTARRLIRSYGLLIAIALAFLIMALFVREKERTVPAESIGVQTVEVL